MALFRSADPAVKITTRNARALVANLRAFDREYRDEVRDAVIAYAAFTVRRVRELVPKDTYYMSHHTRADISKGGYRYEVGWWETDFVGKTGYNNRPITQFYPLYQEFGWHDRSGRFHPGKPSLFLANEQIRPLFLQELDAALKRSMARAASRAR